MLSTLLALALNLLFRLGVRKTVRLTIESARAHRKEIEDFLHSNAAKWGARPDVVNRATFGAMQLLEAVEENCWRGGPLTVEASFDEFNLDIRVSYEGELLEFPDRRPSNEQIRDSDNGVRAARGLHVTSQRRPCALGCQGRAGAGAFPFRSLNDTGPSLG